MCGCTSQGLRVCTGQGPAGHPGRSISLEGGGTTQAWSWAPSQQLPPQVLQPHQVLPPSWPLPEHHARGMHAAVACRTGPCRSRVSLSPKWEGQPAGGMTPRPQSMANAHLLSTGWGNDPQTSEHGECTSALNRRPSRRGVRLIAAGSRPGVEPAEQLCGGKLWTVTLASGDAPMRRARLQPQPQPAVRHGRRRAQPVAAEGGDIPRPSHGSATPRFH